MKNKKYICGQTMLPCVDCSPVCVHRTESEVMTGISRVIEEQSELIMRQADTISQLSSLLLQQCQVAKEELAGILGKEETEE